MTGIRHDLHPLRAPDLPQIHHLPAPNGLGQAARVCPITYGYTCEFWSTRSSDSAQRKPLSEPIVR